MKAICRTVGFGQPYFGSPQVVQIVGERYSTNPWSGRKYYIVLWYHPREERWITLEKLERELEFIVSTCPMTINKGESNEQTN